MQPEIIITSDGSHTLFVRKLNEPYHSVKGAIAESKHVFIQNGFLFHRGDSKTVFEVGFGTGLNCLLTALVASKHNIAVKYIGVEKFPLDKSLLDKLNYPVLLGKDSAELWETIQSAPYDREVGITANFNLLKLRHDMVADPLPVLSGFDVVYFDAFAPDVQPEMWGGNIFSVIYNRCNTNAVFTTYSAKGIVRRSLASIGFKMERIPGPPGKKEMLRGIKTG